MRSLLKYMAPGGLRAWPLPLGALGRAAGARGEARARGPRFARGGVLGRGGDPLARTSPRAPAARPKAPKGRGQALGPPVAMYFHKKRIEIT